MRHSLLLATGWLLCFCGSISALDLRAVERTTPMLPELKSGAAQYCLLAFGPDARETIWLVHDGDRLFVDRNGNGDLTEPGETVTIDDPDARPGVYSFEAGDIPTSAGVHKDLRVGWGSVEHVKDISPEIKARLQADPNFRACTIWLDVAMPGLRGNGIDGRVPCTTSIFDTTGLLEFSPRPKDAPVIHFGGPWQLTVFGKQSLRIGKKDELVLSVVTPGIGPGTNLNIGYEKVIPADLRPLAEITWPAAEGATPLTTRHELPQRCCTVNLYGDVAIPAGVGPGMATVRVSLPQFAGASVAPTTHQVAILPPLPGLKREPVSSRLTRRLKGAEGGNTTVAIQFSPDGRRLIAGDYPGGKISVWDVESGRELTRIEAGNGLRSTSKFFLVTPDWKKILAPERDRGTYERFERDGKSMYRVRYDGSIKIWDLESGQPSDPWKTDPPRSTMGLALWPDHKSILAHEDTRGEFESFRPEALSLWDIETGQHRQLFANRSTIEGFSDDGKQAAVLVRGDDPSGSSLDLYDVSDWKPAGPRIRQKPLERCSHVHFLDKAGLVVGTISTRTSPHDYSNETSELKFWKLPDLSQSWSYAFEAGESPSGIWPIPGQDAMLLSASHRNDNSGRLLRVDVATHEVRVLFDQRRQSPRTCVFDPGAKWFVMAIHEFPESAGNRDIPLEEFPQPHLQVRDVTTGDLLEDLVAPPCYMNSLAFSPDGETLASSGAGEVLLWDFSDSPGNTAKAVVGQPFEPAGTLVDGRPLDPAAFRGKVLLVVYWATWCQPCVEEIPRIKKVYDALHGRGFEVLGVSFDDDRQVLERFLDDEKVPWPVVCGMKEGELGSNHPLARRYGVDAVPKLFLVDRAGKIAAIDPRTDELAAAAEKLLAAPVGKKASD